MTTTAESRPYQLIIPMAIYNASDISPTAKLIVTEIFNLFKAGNKHCYASNGHFAEMFSLERANVSYHIQQLIKHGWIFSKSYKRCDIENCSLKETGWHRHIIAGDTLSKILDSLSSKTIDPIKLNRIPYQVGRHDKNNNEKNIENNNNTDEKVLKLIDKITLWAFTRAKGTPSCTEDSFRRAVSSAIRNAGNTKVYDLYSESENALTFLTQIKRL